MNELEKHGLNLRPGDKIYRRELHERLGGQTQSGISPSSKAPVILLFSDPSTGEQHGYFDGWHQEDGFFHYSGEGQRGDQEMKRGNRAIRDHLSVDREIHLFRGTGKGGPVIYVGQFVYVDHYETDAPESGNGPIRKVFMFRLRSLDAISPVSTSTLSVSSETIVEPVPVEQHLTEHMVVDPSREFIEADRRESELVQRYRRHLETLGTKVHRHRVHPAGELKPLFSDIFDPARGLLIEAKGTTTREATRMAVGQLLDYARFLNPRPALAVLVPSRPRPDLIDFLSTYEIGVIYPVEEGWFVEELSEISAA